MPQEQFTAPERILACVDGSETGYRAANFATALAERLGSRISFVNVVGASTTEKNYRISADMIGSFETLGEEALNKCAENARKRSVQFETKQLSGDPAEEILKLTNEIKCDCIVVGRKEISGIQKLLLGSVSEKILRLSEIPVILVK